MFTIIRWVIAQKSRLPLPFVRIGIGIYNRFKKKKKKLPIKQLLYHVSQRYLAWATTC